MAPHLLQKFSGFGLKVMSFRPYGKKEHTELRGRGPVHLMIVWLASVIFLLGTSSNALWASEFGGFNPIAVPESGVAGGAPVEVMQPVDPRLVHKAVAQLVETYNLQGLENFLSPTFFNRSRLLDNIGNQIPRDARLRVLSIQGIQTLNQSIRRQEGQTPLRVSTVSVTVRTQLQFNNPTTGFDRRDGTNEWIFTVYQVVKP